MKKTWIIIGIIFVISTIFELWLFSQKKKRENQLVQLLSERKYKEFDRLMKEKSTKYFVSVYNSYVLQMNKAIITKDNGQFIEVMKKIRGLKMNDNQKAFVYSRAFSYSLSIGDKKRCEGFYKEIEACKDSPMKQYTQMVYDTMIKKGYTFLPQAQQMLKNAQGPDKENLQVLVDAMLNNKGQKE